MMNAKENWEIEDRELDQEFAEVIQFARTDNQTPKPSRHLDRKILGFARQQQLPKLEKNWLLGQGPWVILVTCIAFVLMIIAMVMF